MATDSSVAGYLAPVDPTEQDVELEDLLQQAVVGITGLPGNMVRPRWQPEPPQQPDFTASWVAFGITRATPDVFAFKRQEPTVTRVERDELLYVLHSFYGPSASGVCSRFRDGVQLDQNRAILSGHGIELIEVQEALNIPALVKERWVKRVDAVVVYRRRTSRAYPVLTITAGQLGLDNEHYVTPITVTQ